MRDSRVVYAKRLVSEMPKRNVRREGGVLVGGEGGGGDMRLKLTRFLTASPVKSVLNPLAFTPA